MMVEVTTPPIMGVAMRFITSAPAPWLHRIGRQAGDNHAGGHGFRADALDRAVIDGVAQVGDVAHPAFLIHCS